MLSRLLQVICVEVRVTQGEQPGTRSIGLQFVVPDEAQLRGLNSLISRIVEGNAPGPLQSLKPGAKPKEIRAALDKMPVVHRMQLAARAMATERNYVREDTNPQVLDALARNPNINLTEIKLLVRNQALLVATLERIAEDHRWKRDQELKVLLATHPRVTYALAERLVKEMTDRSLQQALRRPGLPVELKAGLLNPLTKNKLRR